MNFCSMGIVLVCVFSSADCRLVNDVYTKLITLVTWPVCESWLFELVTLAVAVLSGLDPVASPCSVVVENNMALGRALSGMLIQEQSLPDSSTSSGWSGSYGNSLNSDWRCGSVQCFKDSQVSSFKVSKWTVVRTEAEFTSGDLTCVFCFFLLTTGIRSYATPPYFVFVSTDLR